MSIPDRLDIDTLATYFTLNPQDLEIVNRHRKDSNRLGFAVQLCILRYSGWTLLDIEKVPSVILDYVARQVEVDPGKFKLYGKRKITKYEHIQELIKEYRYVRFRKKQYRKLLEILHPYAMERSNNMFLIDIALRKLRERKIILPTISTIERAVWVARKNAEETIFQILTQPLTSSQKVAFDGLLQGKKDNSKQDLRNS